MKTGFTTFTYEVHTFEDDRWLLDTMYDAKWRALDRAEALIAEDQTRAVRVTSESKDGPSQLKTVFESAGGKKAAKQITISRVDDAPVCTHIVDYYRFPSRQTINRLLRTFLDERQITGLELLFDLEHIQAFERNERLMNQAVQRIALLQARDASVKPVELVDKLYNVITQIKDRSNPVGKTDEEFITLRQSGIDGLIAHLAKTFAPDEQFLHLRATLAAHLADAVEFDAKLSVMVDLMDGEPGEAALTLIDETITEILYGSGMVMKLLNNEPEVANECLSLIQLGKGVLTAPGNPHPCLMPINAAMADGKLPKAKNLLIQRIQAHVRSIKSMVTGDSEGNRDALIQIIRALREGGGLAGGPGMCEAVTMRAKITLTHGHDDLSLPESIDTVLGLLPSPAARLGYLLDVSQSALMVKNPLVMEDKLQTFEEKLVSFSSLMPATDDPHKAQAVLAKLDRRLQQGTFPERFHGNLSAKLGKYKRVCEAAIASDGKNTDGEGKKMAKATMTMDRKSVKAGTCVFQAGDEADCAYLLKSGSVEISTMKDDTKIILTTLGPSQIFGELALLDGSARSATATALADCELVVVTQSTLEAQIEKLDGFMKFWLLYLGERIRDLTDKVEKQ